MSQTTFSLLQNGPKLCVNVRPSKVDFVAVLRNMSTAIEDDVIKGTFVDKFIKRLYIYVISYLYNVILQTCSESTRSRVKILRKILLLFCDTDKSGHLLFCLRLKNYKNQAKWRMSIPLQLFQVTSQLTRSESLTSWRSRSFFRYWRGYNLELVRLYRDISC